MGMSFPWRSVERLHQHISLVVDLNQKFSSTIRGSRECLPLEHFPDTLFFVLLLTLTLFMVSQSGTTLKFCFYVDLGANVSY